MALMNTLYAVVLAVGLWMAFGSLQQLRDAKDGTHGCCGHGAGCGKGVFDNITYWTVLALALSFTLIVLYAAFEEFNRRGGVGGARAALGY